MKFRVFVTKRAKADIDRNAAWWANHHSVEQAVAWVVAIENQLKTLAEMPRRFSVATENDHFKYELRQQPIGLGSTKTYRALFTIVDDEVRVLAIRAAEQEEIQPTDVDPDG